jgi:hypothetical protein
MVKYYKKIQRHQQLKSGGSNIKIATPSIPKYFSPLTFTATLTIRLIKKNKVLAKIRYILKLHYVINHIIFNFL